MDISFCTNKSVGYCIKNFINSRKRKIIKSNLHLLVHFEGVALRPRASAKCLATYIHNGFDILYVGIFDVRPSVHELKATRLL